MKSTGEVMGTATSFGKAYEKAQSAANDPVPADGHRYVRSSASRSTSTTGLRRLRDTDAIIDAIQSGRWTSARPQPRRAGSRVEETVTTSRLARATRRRWSVNSADQPLAVQAIDDGLRPSASGALRTRSAVLGSRSPTAVAPIPVTRTDGADTIRWPRSRTLLADAVRACMSRTPRSSRRGRRRFHRARRPVRRGPGNVGE